MRVSKTLLLLYGTRHVVERWVRENHHLVKTSTKPLEIDISFPLRTAIEPFVAMLTLTERLG